MLTAEAIADVQRQMEAVRLQLHKLREGITRSKALITGLVQTVEQSQVLQGALQRENREWACWTSQQAQLSRRKA